VDIHHARIGVLTGSTHEDYVRSHFPDATILNYSNDQDNMATLLAGKTDVMVSSTNFALNAAKSNPELNPGLDDQLTTEDVSAAVRPDETELLTQINGAVQKLKANGTIANMEKRWLSVTDFDYTMPANVNGTGPLLRVGINARREPISFIDSKGEVIGFSAELAYRIGGLIGRRVELIDLEFASLITALQGGRIDAIVDYMSVTEERKQKVLFSERFLTSGSVPIRLKTTILTGLESGAEKATPVVTNEDMNGRTIAEVGANSSSPLAGDAVRRSEHRRWGGVQGFFDNLADSFYSNLVLESRWKLIAQGLLVTIAISVMALIFGTILAFGVCYLNMSRNRLLYCSQWRWYI
jgi:polar amino acid transport system substrate-binding protein